MKQFGQFCTFIIVMVIASITSGWILSTLWSWFISDTFNVIELNIPQSIGLSLIINFLTVTRSESHKREKTIMENLLDSSLHLIAKYIFALGLGYIVTFFL